MSVWEKWQCRGCGTVITNSKERRTLDPDINPAIFKLVVGYLTSLYRIQEYDAKAMLLPQDPYVKGLDRSYICRKGCFSSLEKVVNNERKIAELTSEVRQIKRDFLSKVERLYPPRVEPVVASPTPTLLHPPLAKRQRTTTTTGVCGGSASSKSICSGNKPSSPVFSLTRTFTWSHCKYSVPLVANIIYKYYSYNLNLHRCPLRINLSGDSTFFRDQQRKLANLLHGIKAEYQHSGKSCKAQE